MEEGREREGGREEEDIEEQNKTNCVENRNIRKKMVYKENVIQNAS